jgi:hypothetical protein
MIPEYDTGSERVYLGCIASTEHSAQTRITVVKMIVTEYSHKARMLGGFVKQGKGNLPLETSSKQWRISKQIAKDLRTVIEVRCMF